MLGLLSQIDKSLADQVADGLGTEVPKPESPMNHGVGADDSQEPKPKKKPKQLSAALSMIENPTVRPSLETRMIAILVADGVDGKSLDNLRKKIGQADATGKLIGLNAHSVKDATGKEIPVDFSIKTTSSVLFDAVYIPAGEQSEKNLAKVDKVAEFVNDAFKHCKVIGFDAAPEHLLAETIIPRKLTQEDYLENGLVGGNIDKFIAQASQHRIWKRESLFSNLN